MKKIVTIIISHLNSNNQLEECLRSISLKCFVGQLKVLVQDGPGWSGRLPDDFEQKLKKNEKMTKNVVINLLHARFEEICEKS